MQLAVSDIDQKRDKKIFDKLQKKFKKMENLQLENERIVAKEDKQGGLNEGQQTTLDRNAKHLQQIQDEIEELEDTIRTRNAQREGTQRAQEMKDKKSAAKKKRRANDSDDDVGGNSDDDDFYDRYARVTLPVARASVFTRLLLAMACSCGWLKILKLFMLPLNKSISPTPPHPRTSSNLKKRRQKKNARSVFKKASQSSGG
jgi:myosin heavy subunit